LKEIGISYTTRLCLTEANALK